MKFESELKKGIFVVGMCTKCNQVSWPPSDYCNKCFGNLDWKESSYEGKIIEFSKKNNENFCVVETDEGIRIMCTFIQNSSKPEIGSKIRLSKCGMKNNDYQFIVALK